MEWIAAVNELTPLAFGVFCAIGIVILFSTGRLLVPFQVKEMLNVQNLRIQEANDRADDYKTAWTGAEARNDVLVDYLKQLGVIVPKVVEHLTERSDERTGR
jgi:hypothetical protein